MLFMRYGGLLRPRQLLPDRTTPHEGQAACRPSCSGSSRRLIRDPVMIHDETAELDDDKRLLRLCSQYGMPQSSSLPIAARAACVTCMI